MAAVALRMPSSYVPVEAEEMEYLDGGRQFLSNGIYLSCADLAAIVGIAGTNVYAVAAVITASQSWMCATGVGAAIFGMFAISSVSVAIYVISAVDQKKGLRITFAKLRF